MNKRGSVFVLSLVLSVMLAASAFGSDLDNLRRAIKEKKAKWHADTTSVSALSLEQKKSRLGEKLVKQEMPPAKKAERAAPTGTVDWRNVEGVSYVTPIKNQGGCGSCWAFATTGGLESKVLMATGGAPIDLAEQILVSCSGCGSCSGGSSASASNYVRDTGLPVEICFKYTGTNNLCTNACADWKGSTKRIVGWHRASVSATNVSDLRNAIYSYGPVVVTMYVYNDLYSYRSGVYSYVSGAYVGAHAVLAVGYDDTRQAFIVKNSWGTGWGEYGYFAIAYSEIAGTSHFAYSTMVYEGAGDGPVPPPEPPVLPCTYSISPVSKNFKDGGGSASININTQNLCAWTATSPEPWVTITSGASGTGNGKVTYSVGPNTAITKRTAILSVATKSYTVTQNGKK